MTILGILGVLLIFFALYLWLIAPARDTPDTSALDGWLYAHRGLHDGNEQVPENSLAAFQKAVEAGYGIELDVQRTKDEMLVVFHDGDLRRVCGADLRLLDITYAELKAYPLPDGSNIPLFSEVLALVDGRSPIIVEAKHYGSAERNAEKLLAILQNYHGAYCVESFHPLAIRYFRRNAPDIIRGQLASGDRWDPKSMNGLTHFAMKHLLVNGISRPHFVAYSCPADHTLSMWLMKHFFRLSLAAWTIRDQQILDVAEKDYQWPIFEGFTPRG